MSKLYPLKFYPLLKERIWGGSRLKAHLGKSLPENSRIGESWEISGIEGNSSVVSNGFLSGNDLNELIEVYMDDLVGEKIFNNYGNEFPLLVKFIDAFNDLSVQVHPDDDLAFRRHGSRGKTEMWYILEAEKGAKLVSGFNKDLTREEFKTRLENKTLLDVLNREKVERGDFFFIPSGRIHAIGKGILLAEIQQASDVTYRIYDWDRTDEEGKPRTLHTEQALDAIDFKNYGSYRTPYNAKKNSVAELADCDYFTAALIKFDRNVERDYNLIDSFVIYICTCGNFTVKFRDGSYSFGKGDTVLLPAEIKNVDLRPEGEAEILEVYIK